MRVGGERVVPCRSYSRLCSTLSSLLIDEKAFYLMEGSPVQGYQKITKLEVIKYDDHHIYMRIVIYMMIIMKP